MGTPFGVPDYGIIVLMMFLIAIFMVVEFKENKQPVLRLILVGTSVYMMTLVTSGIGVMSFASFGMYNLINMLRG